MRLGELVAICKREKPYTIDKINSTWLKYLNESLKFTNARKKANHKLLKTHLLFSYNFIQINHVSQLDKKTYVSKSVRTSQHCSRMILSKWKCIWESYSQTYGYHSSIHNSHIWDRRGSPAADDRIKKMWHTNTIEYYPFIKIDEILSMQHNGHNWKQLFLVK